MIALAAAIVLGGARAGVDEWDGSSWVYTPETHASIAPATAESATFPVDSSYWSSAWTTCTIFFKLGFTLIVR